MIEVPIPNDIKGAIKIRFENLGGGNHSAEFLAVVNQMNAMATFQVKLISYVIKDSEKISGNYQIDLSWSPENMAVNDQIKFEFTINGKNTGRTVQESEYEFVILQNGSELYHKPGRTQDEHDFVNYTFGSGQEDPKILRLENIGNSKESAEITFVVTPEFPYGLIPIMFAGILMVMFLSKNPSNKIRQ